MDDRDDAALVAAATTGDKAAFAELVRRHSALLAGLCRRALGNASDAEDIAQEAILAAMLGLDRLCRPERFGPWLAGIGLNLCRRWLRQRPREAWSWEAIQGGVRLAEPLVAEADPALLAEAAETRERLRRAIAALPAGQRAAVALFYLDGLTQREAAAELGIADGAVKTRLFKARSTLRERLEVDWKEGAMAEARAATTKAGQEMVEVRLADVIGPTGDADHRHYRLSLREVGGERAMTIYVGEFEGTAAALHLAGTEHPRPLTYAFAAGVVTAAGGIIREARIARLEGDVFYATAVVEGRGGTVEVDARPSDAINLALVAGSTIKVAAEVIDACNLTETDAAPAGDGSGAAEIAAAAMAARERTPRTEDAESG